MRNPMDTLRGVFMGRGQAPDLLAFSIASYGGIGVAGAVTALQYLAFGLWGGAIGGAVLFGLAYAVTTALLALLLRSAFNAG